MLQLYVLLQRPLRPVAPSTEICDAIILPFYFLGGPAGAFAIFAAGGEFLLLDLLLDVLVTPGLVESGELVLDEPLCYFHLGDAGGEGVLDLALLQYFRPQFEGGEVDLLEFQVVLHLDVPLQSLRLWLLVQLQDLRLPPRLPQVVVAGQRLGVVAQVVAFGSRFHLENIMFVESNIPVRS